MLAVNSELRLRRVHWRQAVLYQSAVRGARQIEELAESRKTAAGEPPERLKLERIDPTVANDRLRDVYADDPAHDQMVVGVVVLNHAHELRFERDRRFGNARRLNEI